MYFTNKTENRKAEIIELFESTFSDSEGQAEGRQIGQLVSDLFETVADRDIQVFCALEDDTLLGSIIFTRIRFADDDREAFMLSPVAVATNQQGKGVGQVLLNHALDALRNSGVDAVFTYGDIKFYSKVGFEQIDELIAQPPLPLNYPHGWLGQSLQETSLRPLKGSSECVEAFQNPEYW